MMATRKPKIAPTKHAQKEQKTSSSEEIELKDQGWSFLSDVFIQNFGLNSKGLDSREYVW